MRRGPAPSNRDLGNGVLYVYPTDVRRLVIALVCAAGCGRFGFGDDSRPDVGSDAGPYGYVDLASGWTVAAYRDFSSDFTFDSTDFIDGAELYSNVPSSMFLLRAPYPETLCVIAGRELLELTATAAISHDFGNHAPNVADLPDNIRWGTWASNVNAGTPGVLIASSSDGTGDGVLSVSTLWQTTTTVPQNNTRAVAWDANGAFNAVGSPEGYLASSSGVRRYSDLTAVIGGDTNTIVVIGPDLYLTRTITIDVDVRLIRVGSFSSGMNPEIELARASHLKVGDGTPTGGIVWALLDQNRLGRVVPGNLLETIATSTDPDAKWYGAVTPPPGHALATAANLVYVLESNVTAGRFRVLTLVGP